MGLKSHSLPACTSFSAPCLEAGMLLGVNSHAQVGYLDAIKNFQPYKWD